MPTVSRVAPDDVLTLRQVLASGEAMLFTGAGFSSSALSRAGQNVPTTEEVRQLIWELCFPDEAPDDSSLTDLFHHASRRCPARLDVLLKQRLCVRTGELPAFYERWFAVPWRRAWTLNVDDVELAAAKRSSLPRRIEPLSALVQDFQEDCLRTEALPFIHLNGSIHDGIEHVTFSTTQYGRRLAQFDRWYARFVEDLVQHPFVIVGTRLEEAPLWQTLHASSDCAPEARQAYIVSPKLTRARRELLQDVNIRWLRCSAEEFARDVLTPPLTDVRN